MTENFPKLKPNEVALLRVTVEKGRLLDEDFKFAISKDQKVYTVFDSIGSAIAYAESLIKENRDVECNILGNEMKLLKRINIYEK